MELWLSVINTILSMTVLGILCVAARRINIKREERSKQVLMPFLSLIYCVPVYFFVASVSKYAKEGVTTLPLSKWEFLYSTWDFGIIILINALVMLGYVVIKLIAIGILKRVSSQSKDFVEETASWCYYWEEDIGQWILLSKWSVLVPYIKVIYGTIVAGSILLLLWVRHVIDPVQGSIPIYPVFSFIILGEFICIFSGQTREELKERLPEFSAATKKIKRYDSIRNELTGLFPEQVLYNTCMDYTKKNEDKEDFMGGFVASLAPDDQPIGLYFAKLSTQGKEIDLNYVKSCIQLLHGESTLFCNPFYRDLTEYIIYPMLKQLLAHQKCLIIVGRDGGVQDVKQWVEESIYQEYRMAALWKTEILSHMGKNCDIGILAFRDIYNMELLDYYDEFLKKVGFVILIEPSRILSTGQMGLSLIVSRCGGNEREIVYCSCDRNCDGLLDALSHTLKISITQVNASLPPKGVYTQMFWEADGEYMHHKILPNITRYLGVGTELSVVAIKNHIQRTTWLSSEKFPVVDMKWIVGQYYKRICDYTGLYVSQEKLGEVFHVNKNIWDCDQCEKSFLIVEDEFHNLCELGRLFASRAKKEGFVNIISEQYLARDYMIENIETFLNDAKAIPTIVPDYARTQRNTILKLLMMMMQGPIEETVVRNEFLLCGIEEEMILATLRTMIHTYCSLDGTVVKLFFREEIGEDGCRSLTKRYYMLEESDAVKEYVSMLKNAYYIGEDEKGESYYIGAKLYGHVFQALLPGQFLTFEGKCYEIQSITSNQGVIVRRAADHINGRRYYRQIRSIYLQNWNEDHSMGAGRVVSNIHVIKGFYDIKIETEGYLELSSYENLKKAREVLLKHIPNRIYKNKMVMKLKFPKASKAIQYTICVLLNEVFKTTYPESYCYVNATMSGSEQIAPNLKYLLHVIEPDYEEDCIYIVEDSEIDLGLLVSIDRNLRRYLELITELLVWTKEKNHSGGYLFFGYDAIQQGIAVEETITYLSQFGYQNNSLYHTRMQNKTTSENVDSELSPS